MSVMKVKALAVVWSWAVAALALEHMSMSTYPLRSSLSFLCTNKLKSLHVLQPAAKNPTCNFGENHIVCSFVVVVVVVIAVARFAAKLLVVCWLNPAASRRSGKTHRVEWCWNIPERCDWRTVSHREGRRSTHRQLVTQVPSAKG